VVKSTTNLRVHNGHVTSCTRFRGKSSRATFKVTRRSLCKHGYLCYQLRCSRSSSHLQRPSRARCHGIGLFSRLPSLGSRSSHVEAAKGNFRHHQRCAQQLRTLRKIAVSGQRNHQIFARACLLTICSVYKSKLLIYDAGDTRTTWVSFWKAMALLQFGTTLVFAVPPLWQNENQPDPNVRKGQAILGKT
jgi:hypothetical protein